jgi:hypothetical protein
MEFFADLVAYMPIGETAFYQYFPSGSQKHETLKEMLQNNRTKLKKKIREKLYASSRANELIPLYKLLSNNDELRRLAMVHNEGKLTVKNEFDGRTDDELAAELEALKNTEGKYSPDDDLAMLD